MTIAQAIKIIKMKNKLFLCLVVLITMLELSKGLAWGQTDPLSDCTNEVVLNESNCYSNCDIAYDKFAAGDFPPPLLLMYADEMNLCPMRCERNANANYQECQEEYYEYL